MVRGALEVQLIGARKLRGHDFVGKIDPYVVITYHTQQHTSNVASGKGSNPEWDETFVFKISDDMLELSLKVMDKDSFTDDDYIGEAKIKLEAVLRQGVIAPRAYYVIKDDRYYGEIGVKLTFTPDLNEC